MSAPLTPRRGRRAVAGLAAAAVLSGVVAVVPVTLASNAHSFGAAQAATEIAPVLSKDATWRYLENDTFPSAGDTDPLGWTKAGFDDTAWKSGAGTFGGKISGAEQTAAFDSTNTATVKLEMNAPESTDRVRTYFFRTAFDLTQAQLDAMGGLAGTARVDDGAIIYVNGKEIARQDVPAGSEGLSYAVGGSTGLDTVPVVIKAADLVAGTNTIAVEVKNDRASSSDIWFEMRDLVTASVEDLRAKPTRIILTPTDAPATSQNITFQGAEADHTTGRVEIRPVAGGEMKSVRALLQPASVSNAYGHFSATVTGLKPGTDYTYRVSSNGVWSGWSSFTTADPKEKEFSYIYYGDAQIQLDTTWPSVVKQAEEKAPESIGSVHAGDLIDTASTDSQWNNWFKGMEKSAASTNVMAAPGNHEYSGDRLMTAWKAHFEYPLNNPNDSTIGDLAKLAQGDSPAAQQHRAYFDHWADFAQETVYYTDYQGVRFITVNATRDTTFLRPESVPAYTGEGAVTNVADLWTRYQAAWLDHVLSTTESKWNVVTFHQPVYSTSTGRNEAVLREHWVPVFQKHNIDLVQMGHDHTYARGFNNDDVTDTKGVTDGPVYMVANSGGKHYNLETDAKNIWTLNGATQVQKAQGISTYQVVDVSENAITVKSYIAEINDSYLKLFKDGVELDKSQFKVGDLWDEFTIHKDNRGTKKVLEAGMAAPEFEAVSPTRIILTPTEDPSRSQYVTFQGAEADDEVGRIQFRPAVGGTVRTIPAPIQPTSVSNDFGHFSGMLTGLKPDTAYSYRVSSDGNWSDWATFTTEDPTDKDFSYIYYGDAQNGLDSTWKSVVEQAEAKAPDSIGSVHAGDLIDHANRDEQWRDWFKGMERSASTKNIMAAPGNHEYTGDALMTAWKAHFEYPRNNPNLSNIGELAKLAEGDDERSRHIKAHFEHWAEFAQETVYFTDYQGVRFITVNATRNNTFLTPPKLASCTAENCADRTEIQSLWVQYQAAWLDHVLESSESKWNVVTFHQPVYSTSTGRNEAVLREHWVPVFQKHNIDLVQMGHDHTYARGFNNDDVTDTKGVTDGPVYMVANSGAKMYNLETDAKNIWTLNGATQVQKAQGISTYQVVDVDEDKLTVKSYIAEINEGYFKLFRDGTELDKSQFKVGDLWDEFTVHKTDDGRKQVVEAGAPTPEFEDLTPTPVVAADLAPQTAVTIGQRLALSVGVTGAERLQWQRKLVGGEWSDLLGAHSATLDLGRVHLDDLGASYRVVATAGTKSVTTGETVVVDGTAAPVISTDLAAETAVLPGERVVLAVTARGAEKFQWQSKVGDGEWTDVDGARGARLNLGRVGADEVGTAYRVLVTAATKEVVSAATVLVDATRPPVLTRDLPSVVKVTSGNDVRLQVALDAATPAQLQWQRKQGAQWVNLTGRTGTTLALEWVRSAGQYRVVATAGARTTTSRVVTVQVNRKAAQVKVAKVVARKGRVVQVRLNATADGVASVKVTNGGKSMRRTITLKAGRPVTLKLAKLGKKAKGRAKVSVTLRTGVDHHDAQAQRTVKVKR